MDGLDITTLPTILTVEEAARVLRIGRAAAFDRIRDGRIPSLRLGKRLLVPRAGLERLIEEPESRP